MYLCLLYRYNHINKDFTRFYLKVKETLQELGLKTLPGDDAFYHENKNGVLMGMNLSHVDDFRIAGNGKIEVLMEDYANSVEEIKIEQRS